MNPIDELFGQLRAEGRKAFIPFIAAGDPDMETTVGVIRELDVCGASLIEIGFPFSDPIADGPVIQAAYTRALERGLRLNDIFRHVESLTKTPRRIAAPLLGMASYTLIYRRGIELFLNQAKHAGIAGLIVPDLPVEEMEMLGSQAADRDLKLVLLVTPTTPPERAAKIVRTSTGFVYCVSVAGITGERDRLPAELLEQLRRLRNLTDLPLCVGFGISRPEHVRMLHDVADGVIVGSALVRRLERISDVGQAQAMAEIRDFVQALIGALNRTDR